MVGARLARASGLRLFMALAFLCFFNLRFAYTLPSGETVIEGTATFDRSEPNTLKINTSSDKLIVDYSSFSIGLERAYIFISPHQALRL